jgi:simple sugar transport system permease protein
LEKERMMEDTGIGLWGVPLAIFAGAIRVSTPFIFVSLGESITERSGRINLGLEGTLVFGAMTAYAVAVKTGSPWLGVLAAMAAGAVFGLIHGWICKFPKVNDIAIGIAMMQFGLGLAFFLGKPFIQPAAPKLPSIPLGSWSSIPQVQAALNINALFFIGMALALFLFWAFRNTRPGLILRVVGDSTDAARAMGISPDRVRLIATAIGGSFAAVGGAYLSLYYPGSWNEGISSGQGLMAVALVIFARWNPIGCFLAALLFGGAGALGPALQSVGVSQGYYLFYAAPYVLTLIILIATSSPNRALAGAPGELSLTK